MAYWETDRQNPRQISLQSIASQVGCSQTTASSCLTELEDYGFVAREKFGSLKGPVNERATVFRLTWQPDNEGRKATMDYLRKG